MLKQRPQRLAVDQLNVAPGRKRDRIASKATERHDIAAGGVFGGHDPIQLAHDGDGDLLSSPLLTLHEEALLASSQNEIHAAVWGGAAFFRHFEPALPKSLCHQALELLPRERCHGRAVGGPGVVE